MRILYKLSHWYFTKKALPYWCILLIDCGVVFTTYLFIYQQLNSGTLLLARFYEICFAVLICTAFYGVAFKCFHTYSGILRYSSFVDLQRIANAVVVGGTASYVVAMLARSTEPFGLIHGQHIMLASLLSGALLWALRILMKILYEGSVQNIGAKYTYIYGTDSSAVALAKHFKNESPQKFNVRGFVTEDRNAKHYELMGERIYMLGGTLIDRMKKDGVEAFVVTNGQMASFRNKLELQNAIIKAGIKIYVQRNEEEWNTDSLGKPALKHVDIEDLLPREEIEVNMEAIGNLLTGKRILITGAAGSIGFEMVKQITGFNVEQILLIDQAETPMHDVRLFLKKHYPDIKAKTVVTSICDRERMEMFFSMFKPHYVFHAAAYKHVPMMEDNPYEAVQNNVYGTKVIADLSVKYGVEKFVMISTDKAVNPTNVMGCSKRICEIYVQSLDHAIKDGKKEGHTQFVTTRFGNVLGSNGSVIPLFREQIRNGGPVTVTHPDIFRYFMLIPEACKLVLEAGTMGHGGEIFVFDMGAAVKIADLAKRMIKLSGAENIEIKYTGLRDGEKLYEEVLNAEETTKPSFHDRIRIADVRVYNHDSVLQQIDDLIETCKMFDNMQIVKKMKDIVPEYKSNNSVYEILDK
ncbi:polysaccharide biosynthesis protein [Xylanibacter caecicola]|uniref:polysaccharide biosynthesis protein n=1 Tax=Xylanibacter caecicola TaxID=2736294 RepID=UPI00258F309C|nr:nucleoside-diphosphate sugar epimerase/dehydratase [Xylanibacter caecicola]